jgi:hypothetical protein
LAIASEAAFFSASVIVFQLAGILVKTASLGTWLEPSELTS